MLIEAQGAGSQPLDQWRMTYPGVATEYLQKVIFTEGKFIAYGNYGAVLTSEDGIDWERHTSVANWLRDLLFQDDSWWAVGDKQIMRSADAVAWQQVASTGTNALYGISYGANRYVAVGWFGAVYTSADGDDWNYEANLGRHHLYGVTYGAGHFVTVGSGGFISTSVDGTTWTERRGESIDPASLNDVAFYGGRFFASGAPDLPVRVNLNLVSDDGITWTPLTIPGVDQVSQLHVIDDWLIGFAPGALVRTDDGDNWEILQTGFAGAGLRREFAMASGAERHVVVGSGGMIKVSDDLERWTTISGEPKPVMRAYAFGKGVHLLAGENGAIQRSTDGVDWLPVDSPTTNDFTGLTYGENTFIATRRFGAALLSDDGLSWRELDTEMLGQIRSLTLKPGELIVELADGSAFVSSDGEHWIPIVPDLIHAAHGNGVYVRSSPLYFGGHWGTPQIAGIVAHSNGGGLGTIGSSVGTIGDSGHHQRDEPISITSVAGGPREYALTTFSVSEDGQTWTDAFNAIGYFEVTFNEGRFWGVDTLGGYSPILSSVDGVHWSSLWGRSANFAGFTQGIVFGIDQVSGRLYTAPPQGPWKERSLRMSHEWAKVTPVEGRVMLFSITKELFQSAPLVPPLQITTTDSGEAQISLRSGPEGVVHLEYTENLPSGNAPASWSSLGEISPENLHVPIDMPAADSTRFYRAVTPALDEAASR